MVSGIPHPAVLARVRLAAGCGRWVRGGRVAVGADRVAGATPAWVALAGPQLAAAPCLNLARAVHLAER